MAVASDGAVAGGATIFFVGMVFTCGWLLAGCSAYSSGELLFDESSRKMLSQVYELDGSETVSGWRLTSLEVRSAEVDVRLHSSGGLDAGCVLRDPRRRGDASIFLGGLAISSSCWANDAGFYRVLYDRVCAQRGRVWWHFADGSSPDFGGLQDRCLGGADVPNDSLSASVEVRSLLDTLGLWSLAALATSLVALLLLALGASVIGIRRIRRVDIGRILPSVGLFATAFPLRWFLPLHSSVHENHHGYHYIQAGVDFVHGITPFGAPSTTLGLAALANSIFKADAERIFLINAILSAAAVVGLYHLAGLLYRSRLAAWTAATLLLFLPVAIALAPTEEFLVTGSGFFLCGAPLLYSGTERDSPWAFLSGLLLIVMAASVRDIAVLLAATIPLLVALARRPLPYSLWTSWPVAIGVPALLLAPRAAISAGSQLFAHFGMASGVLGVPRLSGLLFGADAGSPFVPNWLTIAAALSVAAMAVHACRSSNWRPFLATVGILLVCRVEAGLVVGGAFPSRLRHHLLAFSLLPLPVGWAVAQAGVRFGASSVKRQILLRALVTIAAGGLLLTNLDGTRLDLPGTREYTFFRDTVRKLNAPGQVLVLDDPSSPVPAITESWIRGMRPDLSTISLDAWRSRRKDDAEVPTYVLFDRTCFSSVPCQLHPDRCRPFVETPLGRMAERCADVWRDSSWTVVERMRIENVDGDKPRFVQEQDLAGVDNVFWIAIASSAPERTIPL